MLQPNSSHFVPMTLDSDIEWSGVGAILIGSPTRVRQWVPLSPKRRLKRDVGSPLHRESHNLSRNFHWIRSWHFQFKTLELVIAIPSIPSLGKMLVVGPESQSLHANFSLVDRCYATFSVERGSNSWQHSNENHSRIPLILSSSFISCKRTWRKVNHNEWCSPQEP